MDVELDAIEKLDLVVFCGQLAAQWPGWPHFKHLEAACPRETMVPPFVCYVEGDFRRPFLPFPFPFDFGGLGAWEVGELGIELSANATTG